MNTKCDKGKLSVVIDQEYFVHMHTGEQSKLSNVKEDSHTDFF